MRWYKFRIYTFQSVVNAIKGSVEFYLHILNTAAKMFTR